MRSPERSVGFNFAALFPPEAKKGGLVVAHDDPGVGAADKDLLLVRTANSEQLF